MAQNKPLIRHCRNCEWSSYHPAIHEKCSVFYKFIRHPRLTAWLCRFYKMKGSADNA